MSRYFIDRPIFAWVIALVLMLAGGLAIRSLPIAQFPTIAPPAVTISATYPGADAQTLENTTTQVIEQQMKGIDNLRYISSTSSSAGTVAITVTFEQGTNPDIAQVQVQNKLAAATPLLPVEVQQQGVLVNKSATNFLLIVGLYSRPFSIICRRVRIWDGIRFIAQSPSRAVLYTCAPLSQTDSGKAWKLNYGCT